MTDEVFIFIIDRIDTLLLKSYNFTEYLSKHI